KSRRDVRAAQRREALDLVDVRDRHDPRDDRQVDAGGTRPPEELEVPAVVEEELRDEEIRPRIHLLLAVAQVLGEIPRLGMSLRIAGASDAEADPALVRDLARELDQIGRMRESLRVHDEL